MQAFKTHTGEIVAGDRLRAALAAVSDWWAENAYAVRREDEYAAHVPEAVKRENLILQLEQALRIQSGMEPMGFWLWQRINAELTGECIAFLPKTGGA